MKTLFTILALFIQLGHESFAQVFEYTYDSGQIDRLLINQPRGSDGLIFGVDIVNQLSFTDSGQFVIQQISNQGAFLNQVSFSDPIENRRCAAIHSIPAGWLVIEDVHRLVENDTRLRVHLLNEDLEVLDSQEFVHPTNYTRAVTVAIDHSSNGDLIMLSTLRDENVNPTTFGYGLYRVSNSLDSVNFSYEETLGIAILYDIMEFGPNDIRITSRGICHNVQNDYMGSAICVAGFDSLWNPTSSYVPEVLGADQNAGMIADSDSTFLMLWNQNVYTPDWQFTEDYSVYRFDHQYNALDSVYLGQTIISDTANRVEPDCIDISADGHIYTASTFQFSVPPFWFLESWIEIYKLDSDLNVVWRRFYGGDAFYYVNSIRATDDGGAIIYSSRSELVDEIDDAEINAYILKVGPDGLLTNLPETAELRTLALNLYPNPSRGRLNVESDLENYSVILRTIDGREVDSWSNLSMGSTLDISNHSCGLYIITVQSQDIDFEYSERIVLE